MSSKGSKFIRDLLATAFKADEPIGTEDALVPEIWAEKLTGLLAPDGPSSATNKEYVDAIRSGIDIQSAVDGSNVYTMTKAAGLVLDIAMGGGYTDDSQVVALPDATTLQIGDRVTISTFASVLNQVLQKHYISIKKNSATGTLLNVNPPLYWNESITLSCTDNSTADGAWQCISIIRGTDAGGSLYAPNNVVLWNGGTVQTDYLASYTGGALAVQSDLDMGTNKITNVPNPSSAQDAATKSYVDTALGSKANTALSNLSTTSINQDLVPSGDYIRKLGTSIKNWSEIWGDVLYGSGAQGLPDDGSGNSGGFILATTTPLSDGHSGYLSLQTGNTAGPTADRTVGFIKLSTGQTVDATHDPGEGIQFQTGNNSYTTSAPILFKTGDAFSVSGSGDSAGITLQTGSAGGGNRGDILLDSHRVNFAAGAHMLPASDGGSDIGSQTKPFGTLWANNANFKDISFGDTAQPLGSSELAEIDGNSNGGMNGGASADLQIYTYFTAGTTNGSGATNDVGIRLRTADAAYAGDTTNHTQHIEVGSGNATGASQASGYVKLAAGTVAGGVRGKVILDGLEIDVSSKKITNLADPTAAQDGATKAYVDGLVLDSIADADTTHAPSRNAVFDALALKLDSSALVQTVTNGDTTHAPSADAVFDAIAAAVSGSGANTTLSNLGTTSINSDLLPGADDTRSLGSSSLRWAAMYGSLFKDSGNDNGIKLDFGGFTNGGYVDRVIFQPLIDDGDNGDTTNTIQFADTFGTTKTVAYTSDLTNVQPKKGNVSGEARAGWFDDFDSGTTAGDKDWQQDVANGGSVTLDASVDVSEHPGVIALDTGTSTNGRAAVYLSTKALLNGSNSHEFSLLMQAPTASDGTDTYRITIGFGETTGSGFAQTNGAVMTYSSGENSANWNGHWYNNTAHFSSSLSTGIGAGAWQKLSLTLSTSSASFQSSLGGNISGGSGNVPTNTVGREFGLMIKIEKLAGTTSRKLLIDWARYAKTTGRSL